MEQYTIKMENFEGPLDLLCHLVDKNKMDICDIKIAVINQTSITAIILYIKNKNIDFKIGINIIIFGILGSIIGSVISSKVNVASLRKFLLYVRIFFLFLY